MRRLALVALVAGLAGLSASAQAQAVASDAADAAPSKAVIEPKAVVELFTSQGCSSCPTADAVLGRLVKRDDIVALSLPVDYWDYLGWKDTLASPKFSERQRAYGKARGDGAIYTPQVIVNGVAHVNGSDEDKIAHLDRQDFQDAVRLARTDQAFGVQEQAGRRDRRRAERDAHEGSHALARRDRQERDGADRARRESGQDGHLHTTWCGSLSRSACGTARR